MPGATGSEQAGGARVMRGVHGNVGGGLGMHDVKQFLLRGSGGEASSPGSSPSVSAIGGDVGLPALHGSASCNNGIGNMNLEQVKQSLGGTQGSTSLNSSGGDNALLELIKEKREKEKVNELRQMKIKHQQLRARKHKESLEIQKTMVELERHKQAELQLRLERERINQGLEHVDKNHLGKLEQEKRSELERLSKERAALQDKEEVILSQVDELERKIIEQEEIACERRRQVEDALIRSGASKSEMKNAQLLDLAKVHGQRTSTLVTEREALEVDRIKLEEAIARLRPPQSSQSPSNSPKSSSSPSNGDSSNGNNPSSIPETEHKEEMQHLINNVETTIAEQQGRIARMKLEMEADAKEATTRRISEEHETKMLRPQGLDKSLPFTVEAESFLNEWLEQDPTKVHGALNEATSVLNTMSSPAKKHQRNINFNDDDEYDRTIPISYRNTDINEEDRSPPPSKRSKDKKKHNRGHGHFNDSKTPDSEMEQEVTNMKREYLRMGVDNPSLWGEIQELEATLYSNYVPQPAPVFGANSNNKNNNSNPNMAVTAQGAVNNQQGQMPGQFIPTSPTAIASPAFMGYSVGAMPMGGIAGTATSPMLATPGYGMNSFPHPEIAPYNGKKPKKKKNIKKKKKKKKKKRRYGSDSSTSSPSSSNSNDTSSSSSAGWSSSAASSRRYRRNRRRSRSEYSSSSRHNSTDLEEKRLIEEQREIFNRTIDGLTKKLRMLGTSGVASGVAAATGSNNIVSTTGEMSSEQSQFIDGLNTLELIPKDSELYEMQLQHLKMMRKMRLEIDELKQGQTVASLKEELERKHRAEQKQAEFDEIKVEQERQLQLARMRRALARENAATNWDGGGPGNNTYDASRGFVVYIDYLTGIPKRFGTVRAVFCIYDGTTVKTPAKALPTCETEQETATKNAAMLVARKKFQKVPALDTLLFVVEVQALMVNPATGARNVQSIGWAAVNLFKSGTGATPGSCPLNEGALMARLRKPPFKVDDLAKLPPPLLTGEIPMLLFLRVVHPDDAAAAAEFLVDPQVTQHMYRDAHAVEKPKPTTPPAKSSKKSKKDKDRSSKKSKKKKQETQDDNHSDIASIAASVVSRGSAARSSTILDAAGSRSIVDDGGNSDNTKRGHSVEIEKLSFDDESPAKPVRVRVTLVPDESFYERHEDDGKVLLSMRSSLSESDDPSSFDYATLKDNLHVWESCPRDIRLSSGQAMWSKDQSNSTFFDGLELGKGSVLLFKVFVLRNGNNQVGGAVSDNEDDLDDEDDPGELIAWACKPVLDQDGSVDCNEGKTAQLELIQPGVQLPHLEDESEWLNGRLFVKIHPCKKKKKTKSSNSASSRSRATRSRHSSSGASRISSIVEDSQEEEEEEGSEDERRSARSVMDDEMNSSDESDTNPQAEEDEPFVEQVHSKPDTKAEVFVRGDDGFDIYVDGARFLPDFTTISCVQLKVFTSSFVLIGNTHTGLPKLADKALSPAYHLRAEYRGEDVANPSATMCIRIDTVDRHSQAAYAVGYALLNVFVQKDGTGNPPQKATHQDFALNIGAFQLPMYQSQPDTSKELSTKALNNQLRVPCATVLVRIVPAKKSKDGLQVLSVNDFPPEEWEKRGLVLPAPQYGKPSVQAPKNSKSKLNKALGSRAAMESYDSSLATPLPCERLLYHNLTDREDALIGELVALAKRPDVPEDRKVDTMEDDELQAWIQKRLEKPHGIIKPHYLAQYHVESGFRATVNRLLSVKTSSSKEMFKVIFSLSPPLSYYGDPKLTEDAAFVLAYDWEAPRNCPRFVDDLHAFKDVPFDPNVVIVVDVRKVTNKQKKRGTAPEFEAQPYAWGVLPVFHSSNGAFVRNGLHQVVLFDGAPDVELLKEMQVTHATQLIQTELASSSKLKLCKSHSSALLTVVDAQLTDCLRFSPAMLNKMQVPAKLAKKYLFEPSMIVAKSRSKALVGTLDRNVSQDKYEKQLNVFFAQDTDIHNYIF